MTIPNTVPAYTLNTIVTEGQTILSVDYLDLGTFLYGHYFHINCIVNTIIAHVNQASSEPIC